MSSSVGRLAVSTFVFVCVWLTAVAVDAVRPSACTTLLGGAMIAVCLAVLIATLHSWSQAGDAGETHSEHRDDEGGGEPRRERPDLPQPRGGGSDPRWWPEFERRFASYVAERETEPAVLPTEPIEAAQPNSWEITSSARSMSRAVTSR